MLYAAVALVAASRLLEAAAIPSQQRPFFGPPARSQISWTSCGSIDMHALECGRLSVPLDYADPTAGQASLSVNRLRADPARRKGSIFTNPGGPGMPGTGDFFRMRAPDMMNQSGGEYDIVSWDIRGVNSTTPHFGCFDSQADADKFWEGSLWYEGVETNSSLRSKFDLQRFYSHVDAEDARLRALWKKCEARSKDVLPYIGSAANARDVASLVDAIEGEGAEINYWGFSYGTVLGQYITALFPDRLGRVILDGTFHVRPWSVQPTIGMYNNLLTDTDKSFLNGFVKLCAEAGPQGCALTTENSTAGSILADIRQLLLHTYEPDYHRLPKGISRSSALRTELFMSLQVPRGVWPRWAEYLRSQQDLLRVLGTDAQEAATAATLDAREALDAEFGENRATRFWDFNFYPNYWSFICGDGPDYDGTTTEDLFNTIVDARDLSDIFGAMWPTEGGWVCHHWRARSVERVTDFRAEPKHPVLLVSNVYDPVTSIQNSYRMMEEIYPPGQVGLAIREGFGHCSYTMKSSCLTGVIQAYLKNWTLPPANMTPCPTEEDLFPVT